MRLQAWKSSKMLIHLLFRTIAHMIIMYLSFVYYAILTVVIVHIPLIKFLRTLIFD